MPITPQALFDYASDFARKAEAADKGTQYPTLREVARRFRVTHDQIESACHDWDSKEGYLDIAVGFRTYSGWGAFSNRGDCLVEAYR
jgi:hypothetical protein